MSEINSRSHKAIGAAVLLHQAIYRKKNKQYIAQGKRTCQTILQASPESLEQLYVTQENLDFAQQHATATRITVVAPHVMEKLSTTKTACGVLGVFHIPSIQTPVVLTPGLVLANISDPGNMGTLIRTSAALGLKNIIIVEGVDPWNPKVVQASAGTIACIQILCLSWQELVSLKQQVDLYALVASGGKKIAKSMNNSKGLLVVGNEAHGLPQEWLNDCNELLTISMPGKTESLNAAIAGSLALYTLFGPE